MIEYAKKLRRKAEDGMDDLFFGGGWLEDLLKERTVSPEVKEKVRERIGLMTRGGEGGWEKDWADVGELLPKGSTGPALERAVASLAAMYDLLVEALQENKAVLEKPFSPFLIRSKEIKKILHPKEDLHQLVRSRDDLDAVISLEMINDARRLQASWGAGVWGEAPLMLLPRLEEDLEELRNISASFQGDNEFEPEDMDKEIELADRFATMATRFAHDLMELHLLNAGNPEVKIRFGMLWEMVRQLEGDRDIAAAAFEALQIFEEALELAGIGGGDLLQRVDLIYDVFADAEDVRRAVDHLVAVSRNGEGRLRLEQGKEYIQTIAGALGDIGLEVD